MAERVKMRISSLMKVTATIFLVLLLTVLYMYNQRPSPPVSDQLSSSLNHANHNNDNIKLITEFDIKGNRGGHERASDFAVPEMDYEWYVDNCFRNSASKDGRSIWDIYDKLKELRASSIKSCNEVAKLFDLMFRFEENVGQLVLPAPFKIQVAKWLDNNTDLIDQVSHGQKVYKISNKWTFEESVFNPLRSKRPTTKADWDPVEYIENITLSTSKSCDFCSYKEHTAADVFGRVENLLSASASNTFKLAKFHGLFFPKSHHPLKLNYSVLADLFINTSQQWFREAHYTDPKQIYPSLLWDSLPHAGASQVHPHIHGLLGEYQYAGLVESMHNVAERYYDTHRRSYWTDIALVHCALGLGIRKSQSVLIVPLNPRKDHEFMIISPSVNEDAIKLLHTVIQSYENNLKVYCWSGGGAYPVLDDSKSGLPMIFRIGSRGICSSIGSDVSSLELYTINNINTDLGKTFISLINNTITSH